MQVAGLRNRMWLALLATSTVVTLALVWFGWRTIGQERDLERQRQRELLESAADTAAAGVRGRLAEAGERLSRGEGVDGAVVVTVREGRVQVMPAGALPFVPVVEEVRGVEGAFAEAERLEFGVGQAERAVEVYQRLIEGGEARIRAEALLRLGRVLRKLGREGAAVEAYRALAKMEDVVAGGVPAELAGLDGQKLFGAMAEGVDAGKWMLGRGAAEFYRERGGERAKPQSWALAEALARVWGKDGVWMMTEGGRRLLGMWRRHARGAAGMVVDAGAFVGGQVPAGYRFEVMEVGGHRDGVVRVLGDSTNPWMLRVWAEGGAGGGRGVGLLGGMLALVIVFLWGTVYFMARAMRREAEAARLQTDFVASVSHEFRSPLTTVRQLAEMLEMDQVPSEERRRKYYQVLSSESRRLQRLVETLLHFGRLEAGAQRFVWGRADVETLVRRAVSEADGGERVGIAGEAGIEVEGDGEALVVAVRNLVENALKYSPVSERVEVRFGRRDGRVFVEVEDRGAGIPKEEQGRVFEKFVRGRAALEGNMKGTGVGLAMVRQIVAAHGGEVQLESEPGRGSTFCLLLSEAR